MASFSDPAAWVPAGGLTLEPAALRAVKSSANGIVVAGPGAGKTELLAQRACYLLQTGICRAPRRILAISFKRDAARNLEDRVRDRLGRERARYFDSYTFDAFAKGLLDRFMAALPAEYRPTPDYVIDFTINSRMGSWLNQVATNANRLTTSDVYSLREKAFYLGHFIGRRLGEEGPDTVERRASEALWRLHLRSGRSRVEFGMIGRLVELLLRLNPLLLKALRATYGHVFLDEFQDTTEVQYDLLATAFRGSQSVLTAVGDDKQRIMGFAGALPRIFSRFTDDFGAIRYDLQMNYRSAPELVRIQRVIVEALEPGTPLAFPRSDLPAGSGECTVHVFPDHRAESRVLSQMVHHWLTVDRLQPRDICILAREKPGEYAHLLAEELRRLGIRARDETRLQDLLAEPLTQLTVAFFRLAVLERHPESWGILTEILRRVRGLPDDESRARSVGDGLGTFCRRLGQSIRSGGSDEAAVTNCLREVIEHVGEPAIGHLYPQYAQGDHFGRTLQQLVAELVKSRSAVTDWAQALDDFIGENSVSIMTVHKSKGLEYHTVIFLGLEDTAFRDFARQPEDERRAFFVAFSRAKQRVLFTFCAMRARKPGDAPARQSLEAIRSLYDLLLRHAGVRAVDHGPPKAPHGLPGTALL